MVTATISENVEYGKMRNKELSAGHCWALNQYSDKIQSQVEYDVENVHHAFTAYYPIMKRVQGKEGNFRDVQRPDYT